MKYILIVFLVLPSMLAFSASDRKPQLPSSMVGLYMVYSSGSITTFSQRKILFLTQTNESYVFSRSGAQGRTSRVKYSANGALSMEDLVRGDMYQQLIRKNRIYKQCGSIYAPAIQFSVKPVFNSKTKHYYSDRWRVQQKTASCKLFTVRHHSDGNWCETICDQWEKSANKNYSEMMLYKNKSNAVVDSRRR